MPLLQGQFDPTLLNATVLQGILMDAISQALALGELRVADMAQRILDELAERKIIW